MTRAAAATKLYDITVDNQGSTKAEFDCSTQPFWTVDSLWASRIYGSPIPDVFPRVMIGSVKNSSSTPASCVTHEIVIKGTNVPQSNDLKTSGDVTLKVITDASQSAKTRKLTSLTISANVTGVSNPLIFLPTCGLPVIPLKLDLKNNADLAMTWTSTPGTRGRRNIKLVGKISIAPNVNANMTFYIDNPLTISKEWNWGMALQLADFKFKTLDERLAPLDMLQLNKLTLSLSTTDGTMDVVEFKKGLAISGSWPMTGVLAQITRAQEVSACVVLSPELDVDITVGVRFERTIIPNVLRLMNVNIGCNIAKACVRVSAGIDIELKVPGGLKSTPDVLLLGGSLSVDTTGAVGLEGRLDNTWNNPFGLLPGATFGPVVIGGMLIPPCVPTKITVTGTLTVGSFELSGAMDLDLQKPQNSAIVATVQNVKFGKIVLGVMTLVGVKNVPSNIQKALNSIVLVEGTFALNPAPEDFIHPITKEAFKTGYTYSIKELTAFGNSFSGKLAYGPTQFELSASTTKPLVLGNLRICAAEDPSAGPRFTVAASDGKIDVIDISGALDLYSLSIKVRALLSDDNFRAEGSVTVGSVFGLVVVVTTSGVTDVIGVYNDYSFLAQLDVNFNDEVFARAKEALEVAKQKATKDFEDAKKKVDDAENDLKKAQKAVDDAIAKFNEAENKVHDAENDVHRLKSLERDLNDDIKGLKRAMRKKWWKAGSYIPRIIGKGIELAGVVTARAVAEGVLETVRKTIEAAAIATREAAVAGLRVAKGVLDAAKATLSGFEKLTQALLSAISDFASGKIFNFRYAEIQGRFGKSGVGLSGKIGFVLMGKTMNLQFELNGKIDFTSLKNSAKAFGESIAQKLLTELSSTLGININVGGGGGVTEGGQQGVITSTSSGPVLPKEIDDRPVCWGSFIRLVHLQTLNRLHSHPINYNSGSRQQQITGYSNFDANDMWEVRAPHNATMPGARMPIKNGDVVCLRHCFTGAFLHSHYGFQSPYTRQQEVTGFYGKDDNDYWRVELIDDDDTDTKLPAGTVWTISTVFRLIHVNTNAALHSHNEGGDQREVTGYQSRDKNDMWFVEGYSLLREVRYGGFVSLMHYNTSLFLTSRGTWNQSGASGQQGVEAFDDDDDPLTCVENPEDVFQVVPGLNIPQPPMRSIVTSGAVIRLRNVVTGMYLHSHPIMSPAGGRPDQYEVTLFGGRDTNDNWRVEVDSTDYFGCNWQTSSRVKLIHVNTNCALHSHDCTRIPGRPRSQEVTAFKGRDTNDFWIIPRSSMWRCDMAVNPNGSDGMEVPRSLTRGASVRSMNNRWLLTHQNDGNVVLYDTATSPNAVHWSTKTSGRSTSTFYVHENGDLVLFGSNGTDVLWNAAVVGMGGRTLYVHNDGNVILRGKVDVWETQTYGF